MTKMGRGPRCPTGLGDGKKLGQVRLKFRLGFQAIIFTYLIGLN